MAGPPDHHCPGCGAAQKVFLRYPWYFCAACRDRAEDREGRRIVAGNTAVSGGFAWRYADEPERAARECRGVVALIDGRPALLQEARFGGVVAEPVSTALRIGPELWRLDLRPARPPQPRR